MKESDFGRILSKINFYSDISYNGTRCWEWKDRPDSHGYGQIRIGNKMRLVYQITYRLVKGPLPEGEEIDHLCRNTLCVNPDHLQSVTHRENVLRGISPHAKNAKKIFCKNGHPLWGDNARPFPSRPGHRVCRACISERNKRSRALEKIFRTAIG